MGEYHKYLDEFTRSLVSKAIRLAGSACSFGPLPPTEQLQGDMGEQEVEHLSAY